MSKPIVRTLGGDRVGSGNRMKQEMHNFYRSNKNLSKTWASTMAPGVLYPAYVNWALKGDTFDIDMNAFVRTVPTIGPLYGSFKLQLDFYQVPVRLYQGILHNNTTNIARKMNQVYFPQVLLKTTPSYDFKNNKWKEQINPSALMRYLNVKGIGTSFELDVSREFNAVPMLAYYDIFKNYYANKQEEDAYIITPKEEWSNQIIITAGWKYETITEDYTNGGMFTTSLEKPYVENTESEYPHYIQLLHSTEINTDNISIEITQTENGVTKADIFGNLIEMGYMKKIRSTKKEGYTETIFYLDTIEGLNEESMFSVKIEYNRVFAYYKTMNLQGFELANIDQMRKYLLTRWDLGQKTIISNTNQDYLPYSAITGRDSRGFSLNKYPLNGLVVKCYQSDLFNNWLDTEWVNEITSASAVNIVDGSFTIDALNFKKKLYDHLNRLAISGGTYDDWQAATYGEEVWGKSEKPIYCGGMSSEVVFDEVISTAATNAEEFQPLGTIGGRGTLNGRKGGKITIKVGEASVIMAIVSLTPRLFYTQGNAWYNTELISMDDLHKPIFDRIGFQDLMVEQMAWWDALWNEEDAKYIRHSAGKQPAWINYATDFDEAYGDFAQEEGLNYMILARNYECNNGAVSDVTTYIDPAKFNYAFAYKEIDAQNFWTFINYKIHARRKMSNTQIPNV